MKKVTLKRWPPQEEMPRLSDLDTADKRCKVCKGCGWVCENHMTLPWEGISAHKTACGCGAGAPCKCNGIYKWQQKYAK